MANISDIIESFLLQMFDDDETLSISRNELATYFACAPSQINYVLSTRFTPDKGFTIESRRGGGGFITLIRINDSPDELLSKILEIPQNQGLSYSSATSIIDRLKERGLIMDGESAILKSVVSDKALLTPILSQKDILRTGIIKSVAIELYKRSEKAEVTKAADTAVTDNTDNPEGKEVSENQKEDN